MQTQAHHHPITPYSACKLFTNLDVPISFKFEPDDLPLYLVDPKPEGAPAYEVVAALRAQNVALEQQVLEHTAALESRNHEVDQFAHVASHELSASLRAIKLLVYWISEDAGDLMLEPSRQHLAKLRKRIKRTEQLVADLIAYLRADHQCYPLEIVDTAALVRTVIDTLACPQGFAVTVDAALPTITIERAPLAAVFRNLIENALKHHPHPDQGHVEVSALKTEAFIQFTVTDDGAGIDPIFHERIFQIFQSLKPREQVEGSGLGLAVVKKLVESRGGTTSLESSRGRGASFSFTWPTEPAIKE